MQIIIKNWECENLRIPDMNVDLGPGINFFQVPNGGGKTTLIELIRATLSNTWNGFHSDEPGELNFEALRDEVTIPYKGFFNLTIAWIDHDKKENLVTFENNFNFENGSKASYTITAKKGKKSSYDPPRQLIPFLTKGHTDVFLFAGDDVDAYFMDVKEGKKLDAPVDEAIDSFAGIDGVSASLLKLKTLFDARNHSKNKVAGSTWDKKSKSLNSIRTNLIKHKEFLEKQANEKLIPWQELDNRVNNLDKNENTILAKRNELVKKLDVQLAQLKIAESDLSDKLRNPYCFSKNLSNTTNKFLKRLQDAKMPGHTAEFFIDIADGKYCICGEPITETRKVNILNRKDNYLGAEHTDVVNRMKNSCRENIDNSNQFDIKGDLADLLLIEDDRQDTSQQIQVLENTHKKNILTSEEIKKYEKLGSDIKDLKLKIKDITQQDMTKVNLKSLRIDEIKDIKSLKDCEILDVIIQEKKAQASGYASELKRWNDFNALVKEGSRSAREKISSTLTDEMNKKISKSLEKTYKVKCVDSKIRIERKKNGGSMGQKITTVSAFATSLLERTGITFPLIIDHPVMPVELEGRPVIARMLLDSDTQMITLVVNSEKDGFILKPGTKTIHPRLEHARFITMSRVDRGVDAGNIPKSNDTTITNNGVVSYNKDYFKDFILEGKDTDV